MMSNCPVCQDTGTMKVIDHSKLTSSTVACPVCLGKKNNFWHLLLDKVGLAGILNKEA